LFAAQITTAAEICRRSRLWRTSVRPLVLLLDLLHKILLLL